MEPGATRILLLGPHGTGKGTLGRGLAAALEGRFLSAGELLRAEARSSPEGERRIGAQLKQGKGVSMSISYPMLAAELERLAPGRAVVLDGFPREASQIGLLESTLGGPPYRVLALHAPTEISVGRLLTRLTCDRCERSYGPAVPPRRSGECDDCGVSLVRRDDDKPPGVQRRHSFWLRHGPRILAHYQERGLVDALDASGAPGDVLAAALDLVRTKSR